MTGGGVISLMYHDYCYPLSYQYKRKVWLPKIPMLLINNFEYNIFLFLQMVLQLSFVSACHNFLENSNNPSLHGVSNPLSVWTAGLWCVTETQEDG